MVADKMFMQDIAPYFARSGANHSTGTLVFVGGGVRVYIV